MINVTGYRILVKPDEVETTTSGGIILALDEKLEAAGQQFGTVIGIGHTCWTNEKGEPLSDPWCEVGDKILFAKHAGRFVYDPHTNEEFMVMLDTDVIATVSE